MEISFIYQLSKAAYLIQIPVSHLITDSVHFHICHTQGCWQSSRDYHQSKHAGVIE